MKKICFIANSLSYGGAEKIISFTASGFAERGDRVFLVNLLKNPGDAGRLDSRVTVIPAKAVKIRYLDRLDQTRKILKAVRAIRPDLIISFTFTANYLASLTGKTLGIPVIISERCDPSRELVLKGHVKACWNLINSMDGGVFQTEGAMRYYSEGMQARGTIIPNPAVLEEEIVHRVRANGSSPVVVSVGRLENQQKRYDVMLGAFRLLLRSHPDCRLEIYGTGPDEAPIRSWIAEHGMEKAVRLMGRTDHPLRAMDAADIFLTTSDYEGISNALLEAMAIGMPVVATDCSPGGARLLIRNGENGLLVPCGNTAEIAAALGRMAADHALRLRCGENAKKVREEYDPRRIMDLWTGYADRILGTKEKACQV